MSAPKADMPMSDSGPWVDTQLHDHQKAALSKLLFIENDYRSLYEALVRQTPSIKDRGFLDLSSFSHIWTKVGQAWKNHLDDTIRNVKIRPFQSKGIILADDMGTGKSLTILALVKATLEAADEWLRNTQADPEVPQYRLPLTFSFEEIYIDNPPPSDPFSQEFKTKFWNRDNDVTDLPQPPENNPAQMPKSAATLIVCPKTVVPVWIQAIKRHWSGLKVFGVLEAGPSELSQWPVCFRPLVTYDHYSKRKDEEIGPLLNASIVLTSYQALSASSRSNGVLHQVCFYRVVLDEGHTIRNPDTRCFKAAQALHTRHLHILTGTPIQNHPVDLVAYTRLLEIPSETHRVTPFQTLIDSSALQRTEADLSRLRVWGKVFMLRRLKRDLDGVRLPDKTVRCFWLKSNMEEEDFVGAEDGPSRPWLMEQDGMSSADEIIRRNQWFANVANHMRDFAIYKPPQTVHLSLGESTMEEPSVDVTSVKMRWFKHFLETQNHGKIVVFHHFHETFDKADILLQAAGYQTLEIQADTKDRAEVAKSFNDSRIRKLCLLASITVAGEGVSLVGATACVHLDLMWKPSSHDQAVDRLHRQGQLHPVTAYIPMELETEGDCRRWIRQQVKRTFARLISPKDPPSEYSLLDFPPKFLEWMRRYDPDSKLERDLSEDDALEEDSSDEDVL